GAFWPARVLRGATGGNSPPGASIGRGRGGGRRPAPCPPAARSGRRQLRPPAPRCPPPAPPPRPHPPAEIKADETAAPHQSGGDAGAGFFEPNDDRALVPSRRRLVPHQYESHEP